MTQTEGDTEKKILNSIHNANGRIVFWRAKVKVLQQEHKEFKKELAMKELIKAVEIIESIRVKYEYKNNFHRKRSRKRIDVYPIYKTIKLVSCNTEVEMTDIGKLFNRDRTLINHAIKTVEDLRDTDKVFKAELRSMCRSLKLRYRKFKPRAYTHKYK